MFHAFTTWVAANSGFCAAIAFTAVAVIVCTIVFPQDGSGGDFDFGGDSGGD